MHSASTLAPFPTNTGCAAGYKWDANSNKCVACGANSYCLGSKATREDSASAKQNIPCGGGRVTTSSTAKSAKECLAPAGYAWSATGDLSPCSAGTYNPGNNQRACTRCPGGLTSAAGSESPAACVAPPGSYYLRGKAIPCAQGTFKADAGNVDCDECPDGTTTAFGTVGATAATACTCECP